MKAVNKVRLIYLPAIVLPIFVMIVSIAGLSIGYSRINKADLSAGSFERFVNPLKTMNTETQEIFFELEDHVKKDPQIFDNEQYLNNLNERLKAKDSYLIVRKNGQIQYIGKKKVSDKLIHKLPSYGNKDSDADRGFFVSRPGNYLVKQQDFKYNDGGQGSVFIMTDLGTVLPHYRNIIIQVSCAVIGVLILTSTFLSWFMYREFVGPIRELKAGAERIKEGNLDNDVVINSGGEEIRELCNAFNEMRAELKDSIDARIVYEKQNRDLISNISHDLKTPVTTIKGYAEGIMDGVANTPEKMDRYIRTIYNKANEMDRLINELTFYSKIDTNRIPYTFSKIHIADYFDDCVEELNLELDAQHVDLTYFNYLEDDPIVIADAEQIKRVINNIVSNSIKYMDKSHKVINIRLRDVGDFVQVEIEDNGKGIATKDLTKIFDRFYRTDASRNSTRGGSGIGLSIVKKILEDHGGKVWATSKEGVGTTMYFVLRKYQEVPVS